MKYVYYYFIGEANKAASGHWTIEAAERYSCYPRRTIDGNKGVYLS
jgi:hypothetical protein